MADFGAPGGSWSGRLAGAGLRGQRGDIRSGLSRGARGLQNNGGSGHQDRIGDDAGGQLYCDRARAFRAAAGGFGTAACAIEIVVDNLQAL